MTEKIREILTKFLYRYQRSIWAIFLRARSKIRKPTVGIRIKSLFRKENHQKSWQFPQIEEIVQIHQR